MSGHRDEEGYTPTRNEAVRREEEEEEAAAAARLRASLAIVLTVLPPSPGSLPGCSPSFFGSATPNGLPETTGMDGDRILLEDETQVLEILLKYSNWTNEKFSSNFFFSIYLLAALNECCIQALRIPSMCVDEEASWKQTRVVLFFFSEDEITTVVELWVGSVKCLEHYKHFFRSSSGRREQGLQISFLDTVNVPCRRSYEFEADKRESLFLFFF